MILYILLLFITFLIYHILLKPYFKLIKLKTKHGNEIYVIWYPLSGQTTWETQNEKKYGNPYEELKQVMKNYPNLKAIAFIAGFNVQISSVDPELTKAILLDNHTKLKKYLPIFNFEMTKNGLPFQEGEEWKQTRRLIADSFHFESLLSRFQAISNVVQSRITQLEKYSGKDFFPLSDEMLLLSGEIGLKVLFGPDFEDYEVDGMPLHKFIKNLKRGLLGDKLAMKFLSKNEQQLLEKHTQMINILKWEVERKLKILEINPEQSNKSDFLVDRFIKAYINKSIPNLTIEKLATFLFASLDTTGSLLAWIFYAIAEHKEEGEKVLEEINQIFKSKESLENMVFDDMKKLTYTSAFIEECQRKYNSVPGIFHREVVESFKVGRFQFEKGDILHQHYYGGFLNPREFKNPETFKVERFLNRNEKEINPYIFSPFSVGPRNCIGKYMAQLEMKIVIIYFLKRFNLQRNTNVKLEIKKEFVVLPLHQNLVKISRKE